MEELKAELRVVLEKLQSPELIDIHHGEEQLKEMLIEHRYTILSVLKGMLLGGETNDVSAD
jgi:hypothetical protein